MLCDFMDECSCPGVPNYCLPVETTCGDQVSVRAECYISHPDLVHQEGEQLLTCDCIPYNCSPIGTACCNLFPIGTESHTQNLQRVSSQFQPWLAGFSVP